jgi:hypothetical protein
VAAKTMTARALADSPPEKFESVDKLSGLTKAITYTDMLAAARFSLNESTINQS